MPSRLANSLTGFGLPELLVSMSLLLPVILSGMSLVMLTAEQQALCEQLLIIEQDAQFALELISRAIEHAGYRDVFAPDVSLPPLTGMDDRSMAATSDPFNGASVPGLMGSDILITNFAGSAVLNCAGLLTPVPVNGTPDIAYSAFYLARGAGSEPELRCKYRTTSGWDSEPLISGVEALHFLYGVDRDADGLPDQFMNASALMAEQHRTPGLPSPWYSVVAVKISLLMRSARDVRQSPDPGFWHLFGETYSTLRAGQDKGTQLSIADFPGTQRARLRQVFEQMVFLRNRSALNGASARLPSETGS